MSKHEHRPQKAERTINDETRPLVVKPLENLDRVHNPKDIDVDTAAIQAGVEHGGTIETRRQADTRGTGGRKRSGSKGR